MRRRTQVTLLATTAGLLSIVGLACKGGGTADHAAREIARDDIAMMALAAADFGAEYASFEAGEENGFATAEQRAENSIDPENEAADLKRFGWEAGYEEMYYNRAAGGADSGVWIVGSGTNLFGTVDGAAGYFDESVTEVKEDVGKTKEGIILDAAEQFGVQLADEAAGVHFHVVSQDDPASQYWATAVVFRRGRFIASVSIFSFDELNLEDVLKGLAGKLDEQIVSVIDSDRP